MDIHRITVPEFFVGGGDVDAQRKPLVAVGYAPAALYKGVRIKADADNTGMLYVGNANVSVSSYALDAGEEVDIPIDDIHKVFIVADPAGNASQTVTLVDLVSGGKFVLVYKGQTTAVLAGDAAAAAVQAALEALSTIGAGNVSVSGNAGGPYTVAFVGDLAELDADLMTGDAVSERVTLTVADGVAGDEFILTCEAESTADLGYDAAASVVLAALEGLTAIGADNVEVDKVGDVYTLNFIGALEDVDVSGITGVCQSDEVQTISVSGSVAGDTMVLTWDSKDTSELAFDVSLVDMKSALEALDGIGVGDVVVTGTPGSSYVLTFGELLANTDVSAVSGVGGTDEVQTISVSGSVAGDTMVLTWDSKDTSELAFDVSLADMKSALEALDGIGVGDVVVTGTPGSSYVVTFGTLLANTDVAAISGVGGTDEVQTISVSGSVAGDTMVLTWDSKDTSELAFDVSLADMKSALEALDGIGVGDVVVTGTPGSSYVLTFGELLANTDVSAVSGVGGTDEVQTISVSGSVAGDTMVLTWDSKDTSELAFDVSLADMKSALEALDGIGVGDVVVTGTPGSSYVLTFGELLANTDVSAVSGVGGTDEVQTISVSGSVAGDTMVLTWDSKDTSELAFDVSLADMKSALEALDGIGVDDVAVTGTPGSSYVVTFGTLLANTDVAAISGVGGTDEVQTISVSGSVAGDTMVLTWDSKDTSELAFDVSLADMKSALEALDGIGVGDVVVTGTPGSSYVLTFGELLANTDVSAVSGVGGTDEVQTISVSGSVAGDTMVLTWDSKDTSELAFDVSLADMKSALEALDGIGVGDVVVTGTPGSSYVVTFGTLLANTDVAAISGVGGTDEVQTVTLNGASGGTFTLTYSGQTTANIDWDATTQEVQDALVGLNNIDPADVAVTGTPGSSYVVTFGGLLANQDVTALTSNDTNLIGTPGTITIVETTTGNELTVGVVETTSGNELTVGVVETAKGNELTVGVVETAKGNELTVGVVETTSGNTLTIGVVETTPGNELTVGVVETTPGNELTVGVVETHKGNLGTVTPAEVIKGDADAVVTIEAAAQASDGCDYSWIAS